MRSRVVLLLCQLRLICLDGQAAKLRLTSSADSVNGEVKIEHIFEKQVV